MSGDLESEQIAVLLAEALYEQGDRLGAGAVLREAGLRWGQPLLLKMAANRLASAGDFEGALSCCTETLQLAGREWAGELDTLGIMFDAQEALARHDESLLTAKRMAAVAPENLDARWILIQSLLRHGDLDAAWSALNYNGQPVAPRSPQEVRACIDLLVRFDTSPMFLARALKLFEDWSTDEELQGVILAQIHSKSAKHQLSDPEIAALQDVTATYLSEHPDNPVFRAYDLGTDEDPLEGIKDELKRHAPGPSLVNLNRQIRNGEVSLGVGAIAMGRSYAECAILGISGLVYSDSSHFSASGAHAVQLALGENVVLDPTAAATLARLNDATCDVLIACFSFVDTTVGIYRDALRAQESLALRSTMSIHWSEEAQKIEVNLITQEQAETHAAQANRVVSLYGRARRANWPHLRHLTEFEEAQPWLDSLDYAIETGKALWCDDYLLRGIAQQKGVPAFSTVDLLRGLVFRGELDPNEERVAEAILVNAFYVDLGFDGETMRLAADLGQWQPGGVTAALSRSASWANPDQTVAFVLEGVTKNLAADPVSVQGWVYHATKGIIAAAGDDLQGAQGNVKYLLTRLVVHTSAGRAVFPFLLAGTRSALDERADLYDPLEEVLRSLHASLVAQHGHAMAANLLLAIAGSANEEDRSLTARIILTTPM